MILAVLFLLLASLVLDPPPSPESSIPTPSSFESDTGGTSVGPLASVIVAAATSSRAAGVSKTRVADHPANGHTRLSLDRDLAAASCHYATGRPSVPEFSPLRC